MTGSLEARRALPTSAEHGRSSTAPPADRTDPAEDRRRDPRRAAQAGPPAAELGQPSALLCALPVLVAVFVAVTHLVPPPGQGPALLSAVLSSGIAVPGGGAGHRAAGVPAGRGGGRRRATRSPGEAARACCATCWPGRSGGPAARRQAGRARRVRRWPRSSCRGHGVHHRHAAVRLAPVTAATAGGAGRRTAADRGRGTSLSGHGRHASRPVAARSSARSRYIAVSMLGVARDRAVPVHGHRLGAGRRAGRAGRAGHQPGAGHPGRGDAVAPYLPTRYWLAWIDFFREPILWRDIERGLAVQAVYVVVFLGAAWAQLRDQGRHQLSSRGRGLQAGAVGGARGGRWRRSPMRPQDHAGDDRGSVGSWRVGDPLPRADRLDRDVHRARQPGRVRRADRLVVGRPQRQPGRPRRARAGGQPGQQAAAGDQLLAGDGAGARREPGAEAATQRAVERRAERDDPARLAVRRRPRAPTAARRRRPPSSRSTSTDGALRAQAR